MSPKPDTLADTPDSPVAGNISADLENPDGLPAVDAEHVPPEGDAGVDALEEEAPTFRPLPAHDARKVVMVAMKAFDKFTAILFRIDPTPPGELEEYAAAITPALAHYGEQPGPKFWLGVAFLGLAGFLASRVLEGLRVRRLTEPDRDVETSNELGTGAGGSRSGLGAEVHEPDA